VGKGKEEYEHRLALFIPQIAAAVKVLSSIWVKKPRKV
jgi:hypothetical protein